MTWSAPIEPTRSALLVLRTPVTCAPNALAQLHREAAHPTRGPDDDDLLASLDLSTGLSMPLSSRASGAPYLEWTTALIGRSCVVTRLGERSCLVDTAQPLGVLVRGPLKSSRRTTQRR
jgi:hypothetical protein